MSIQPQTVPIGFFAQEPVKQAQGAPPSQQQLGFQPRPANVSQQLAQTSANTGYPQQPAPEPSGAMTYSAQSGPPIIIAVT